jgi:hypothetical protein
VGTAANCGNFVLYSLFWWTDFEVLSRARNSVEMSTRYHGPAVGTVALDPAGMVDPSHWANWEHYTIEWVKKTSSSQNKMRIPFLNESSIKNKSCKILVV